MSRKIKASLESLLNRWEQKHKREVIYHEQPTFSSIKQKLTSHFTASPAYESIMTLYKEAQLLDITLDTKI